MDAPGSMLKSTLRFVPPSALIAGLLMVTIGSVDAATVTVAAVNFHFQPASRTVNVGDVVRWTFTGDPHSVTSGAPGAPDGRFDSGITDPGGSFQLKFDTAGTFRYFCQIHPEQMTGTIVVRAGSSPSPTPRPTAKPTPRPTAKPTARPTARPTAKPSATATANASATASPSPAATAAASPTATPSASPSSVAPASPSASTAPARTASPAATPSPGSAASVNPLAIVGAAILLGLVAAGALILARRGRSA